MIGLGFFLVKIKNRDMKNTIDTIEKDVRTTLEHFLEITGTEKKLNERDVEMYKNGMEYTLKRVRNILEKL
jgi:hypothetical protein